MNKIKISILLQIITILGCSNWLVAQEPTKTKEVNIRVVFEDGTSVSGVVQERFLKFHSEDNDLNIDFIKIHNVQLGPRLTKKERDLYFRYLSDLESNDYTKRELAQQDLVKMGARIYGQLSRNMQGDAEVAKRCRLIREKLKDRSDVVEYIPDVLNTADITAKGDLLNSSLKIKSKYLGDVLVDLAYVKSIHCINTRQGSIEVLGTQSEFYSIDLTLIEGENLTFTAEGTLDLYSTTPGQYLCDPDGYNQTSLRGFKCGALIYKLDNKVGVLGRGPIRLRGPGRVYLAIERNPWNQKSVGSYKVSWKLE